MAMLLRSGARRGIATNVRRLAMNQVYEDRVDYPAPHIRYRKDSDLSQDLKELREKELGDWKNLSKDDKKALYRLAFHKSYADMKAPTGEWKVIIGGIFFSLALSAGLYLFQKEYILPPPPHTLNEEWQQKQREYMIRMHNQPIEGIASKWDYDKNEWKK
ncbi:cytochrome c oxidase subunit 4 isoform 1, mitochondrial-like [Ptychodera flava]|uniref:cytochrome c oxidase subunit 4 isoform 1, mitochondrial-like n=1 Tax=Ptychodera flava TaxID=63121 RepID=UPI003969C127